MLHGNRARMAVCVEPALEVRAGDTSEMVRYQSRYNDLALYSLTFGLATFITILCAITTSFSIIFFLSLWPYHLLPRLFDISMSKYVEHPTVPAQTSPNVPSSFMITYYTRFASVDGPKTSVFASYISGWRQRP